MAGCALVGQSVMNIDNGGRTRLSTLFSGISLLAMILLARLEQIPMAALVAVMISIVSTQMKQSADPIDSRATRR